MIYTKRQYLSRYLGLDPKLDTVISHLLSADLSQLSPGRNPVDGDRVWVNRFGYQTLPQEQAIWEGHQCCADVHVLLSGTERIGVSSASALQVTQRRLEEDFIGYEGPVSTFVPMTEEDVLIVYPEDVHMVKVANPTPCRVEKVCYKIRL